MKEIVVTSIDGVCVNEWTVFCQTGEQKKEFQWDRGRANIDHSETQGPGVSIYPDAMFPQLLEQPEETHINRTEQEGVV